MKFFSRLEPSRRRFIKMTLMVLGLTVVIILGLHIWFVNNARGVLKQIVYTKSGGKLKLELSKLSFDFLSSKMQVREADLVSIRDSNDVATYHVQFRKLTLRIGSFWSLLVQKKLILDSIKLHDPQIEVTQWRKDTSSKLEKEELSIPQEMGKLYNSMLDVLDGFGIRRIVINNAHISLVSKVRPGSEPVTISRIYLDLLRSPNTTAKRDEYIKDEQTVDLSTAYQNIALPGGRHRLSFKNFNLHLFQKRIELDSCTLTAMATDSSKSNYKIFFDKLLLIGVDFSAMYRYNLIRADSVYCEKPLFDINLNRSDAVSHRKEKPDLERIIRDLVGKLDLAFVGVKDAGIHIDISGEKSQSLFNSNKDDFEMRGLRINADSSKPVQVQRFDMLVQDYHLYNKDSSTAYRFDSIHFVNNKVVLNNFTVATESSNNQLRNERDFKIPYFELTGVDWYQLFFEENLKAQEAVLYYPQIFYVKRKPSTGKKVNLFRSLQTLDDLITLNKIDVLGGNINARLSPTTSFNLQNVNLSLFSNRLLESNNKEGMRRAVDLFSFSSGTVRIKDMNVQLQNVQSSEKNLIHADKLRVQNKENQLNASLTDVYLNNLLLDDNADNIIVDGIRWNSAQVTISGMTSQKKDRGGSIILQNIKGTNTAVKFAGKSTEFSTLISSLTVNKLTKAGSGPLQTEGLSVTGKNLVFDNSQTAVKAASYQLIDKNPSLVQALQLQQLKGQDSLSVQIPQIQFSASFNDLLAGNFNLGSLNLQTPQISMVKRNPPVNPPNTVPPSLQIDQITAYSPTVTIATYRNDSATLIRIPEDKDGVINVGDLRIGKDGLQLGALKMQTSNVTVVKPGGEVIGVEKGKAAIQLSNVRLFNKEGKPSWSATVNSLDVQHPNSFTLGKRKNKLQIEQASAGNLNLSSEYINNFDQLLRLNVSAWLRNTSGTYSDSTTTLKWYNAAYNYQNKSLSLDSFAYRPTVSRDSVIANTPYQTDYISLRTGAIQFSEFNLEKYKKDSAFIAERITINQPLLSIYRDKQPPYLSGISKPMLVSLLKNISLPVSVQQIQLNDGELNYTEKNARSRAEGTLLMTHLNVGIQNIKNRNLRETDSLHLTLNSYLMDSARINLSVKQSYTDTAKGFVMTLQMRPTNLSLFNPVLAPLSNIILTSGTIDSLRLQATGNNDFAFGKMNMYYRNVRIRLVKEGDEDKTTFIGNVISFLANTFLIRNNNQGKTGLVYFERLKDRSFFNYMVKTTFSGLTTSLGIKSNKKYLKQYKEQLKQRNLPATDIQ